MIDGLLFELVKTWDCDSMLSPCASSI